MFGVGRVWNVGGVQSEWPERPGYWFGSFSGECGTQDGTRPYHQVQVKIGSVQLCTERSILVQHPESERRPSDGFLFIIPPSGEAVEKSLSMTPLAQGRALGEHEKHERPCRSRTGRLRSFVLESLASRKNVDFARVGT